MLTFAIDYDGTLVEHAFPEIGPLKPKAVQGVLSIKAMGHKTILWTCREGRYLEEAVTHMERLGVFFDAINQTIPGSCVGVSFANRKVLADYYLDDRSFPAFPGWPAFIKALENGQLV